MISEEPKPKKKVKKTPTDKLNYDFMATNDPLISNFKSVHQSNNLMNPSNPSQSFK